MNTFAKIGDAWGVRITGDGNTGDTITVETRAGARKQVTLGTLVESTPWGRTFMVAPAPRREAQEVGNLSPILAMFARARAHLKHPAIVLDGFRVTVAGARAKEPGTLTVTSVERTAPGRYGANLERQWYGRVSLDGAFHPGRDAPADLGDKLRRFAADPAGEAAAYGRLHGLCCFCNSGLRDERSTAVGYGPICADHFGLPWGVRAARAAGNALECSAV